jgi:hypothetical protein
MKRMAASLLILAQTTACATIKHREQEPIKVRSNPPGASAVIECDGGFRASGTTPAQLLIPRHAKGCALSLSKEGMRPQRLPLVSDISGKYWGALWTGIGAAAFIGVMARENDGLSYGAILFGPPAVFGLVSAAVDAASGRRWGHSPDEIDVKLESAP